MSPPKLIPDGYKVEQALEDFKIPLEELKYSAKRDIAAVTDIGTQLDDIFLLRYCMSHRTTEKALKALRITLEWRQKNIIYIKNLQSDHGDKSQDEERELYRRFQVIGEIGELGCNQGEVIRAALCDPKGMVNSMDPDVIVRNMLLNNEECFQVVNRKTRDTGVFCKVVSLVDMNHFSMLSPSTYSRYSKLHSKASHISSSIYPQLLGKLIGINLSPTLRILYKTVRKLMPSSVQQKVAMCGARNSEIDDISKCPFVKKLQAENQVPPFLGGTMELPPYLMSCHQREGEEEIAIGWRSTETVIVDMENITKLSSAQLEYHFLVQNGSVSISIEMVIGSEVTTLVSEFQLESKDGLRVGKVPLQDFDILPNCEIRINFINGNMRQRKVKYVANVVNYDIENDDDDYLIVNPVSDPGSEPEKNDSQNSVHDDDETDSNSDTISAE